MNITNILKAVIVDDEQDLCFLLEQILRQEHFETTSLNSIHEADERLKEINPAVIFLDNQLPDGLGIRYISNIKEILPSAKVVIMTAYHSDKDKAEAIESGADVFLMKPLSKLIIRVTLDSLHLKAVG